MNTVPLSSERPEAPLFCDGLGERVVAADGATGELLQILRVRPTLTAVPSFEFALRERAARLANFRHAYYVRVRRIDRVQMPAPGLAIVSDHVEGTRLSDILRSAYERNLQLDINTALCLIRQLVPAVALMHENAREVAHGLISPERLIVTPHARLVIVEHVLGAAIEQLQFTRDRLWQEFRIALPSSAGMPRFDHRADVTGVGLVALALVIGRPLRAEEYPHQIPALLNAARERTALGEEQPLSPPLRDWMARTLQIDPRRAFASAPEALAVLEDVVAEESTYVAAPVALETFLSRYTAALLDPTPAVALAPAPAPVVSFLPAPPKPPAPEVPPPAPDLASLISGITATSAPSTPATYLGRQPGAPGLASGSGSGSATPSPELPKPQFMRPQTPTSEAPRPVAPTAPAPFSLTPRPAPSVASPLTPPVIAGPAASTAPSATAPAEPKDQQNDQLAKEKTGPKAFDLQPHQPPPIRNITELIPADDLEKIRKPLFEEEPGQAWPAEPSRGKDERTKTNKKKITPGAWKKPALAAVAVLALTVGGYFAMRARGGQAGEASMGTLDVQSSPAGVQVFIDGEQRGQTPARVSLKAGAHILELRGRGVPRVTPISVTAGGMVSQYIEFADTPVTGQLQVQSQPPGAHVQVDGVDRGVAPVTVSNLTPGDHEVVLQSAAGSAKQVVSVQAGGTASIVAPVVADAASGPVSGWVTVQSPVSVEIREGGKLLGTSEADRVMMAAGRHELEIVNAMLGYRVTRIVQVPPGKTAPIKIDLPKGVVNLNASPWAEVFIDGQRVGETPIGNLSVSIGPHEVVFRNPQLGEKRHAISVSLAAPLRLSVDMK
jgi:serine/threonine protein kinase